MSTIAGSVLNVMFIVGILFLLGLVALVWTEVFRNISEQWRDHKRRKEISAEPLPGIDRSPLSWWKSRYE